MRRASSIAARANAARLLAAYFLSNTFLVFGNVGVSGGARSEPSELSFVKCVIGGARIALKWRAIQQVQLICSLCKARPKVRHRRSLPWILRLTSKQTFVLGDPKSRRYWLELR